MKPNDTTIAICGIGQMGASAAVAFQRAGYRVLLWARDESKLRAVELELVRQSAWSNENVGPAKREGGEILLEPDLCRLDREADVILDCIAEVMELKAELFRKFDDAKKRGALFLSATSGQCGPLLVGAHFWNPPHLIPVVEMIAGADTPPDRLDAACALMEDIDKVPVRCKDVPGFIGNRIMHAMWRECLALVDEGVCTAEDVDRVVKLTFALRLPALGPMENMDLVGLELAERVQRYLLPDLARNTVPAACMTDKIAAGDVGMKSGRGFYDWTKRDARKVIENRDTQIARQVAFMREIGEL